MNLITEFDRLPDGAVVPMKVVTAVTSMSEPTVWRRAKDEPLLKPVSMGPRCTRWNVGNLRKLLAGGASE